jgi:hypothetical protein
MSLLKHLVWFFLRQSVNLDLKNQSVFVISKQHSDFGLIQVERKRNTVGSEIYEINTVAILGGPRQSIHAALVVKSMIDLLTKGSLLMAYCNGHSEEWKNALSRLHFSKQESLLDGIDLFSYEKSDANRSTKFVSMNLLQGAGDFLKFCA